MNRQKLLLLILLLLLVIAVVYAYLRMPKQQSVGRLKYTSGVSQVKINPETTQQNDKKINISLLDTQLSRPSGYKRNIFRLAPLKSSIPVSLPPPPLPPPPPPTITPSPPPPAPPSPVRAEMAKFTFLGFLKDESRKTIFLSKDQEIILVKKGDKIANRFEVTNLTDEALTISSTTESGQIVIPLVENSPLRAQ